MTAEPGAGVRHRSAILGSPVGHSLSPVLHNAAYAELGLTDWEYGRVQLEPDELAPFVEGRDPSWRGFSVTMPLKTAVLALPGITAVSDVARLTGVGNTLLLGPEERAVDNTDVPGLVWAVRQTGARTFPTVTVVGSGATARSGLVAASRLGATRVQSLARDPRKAAALEPLAAALGVELTVSDWDAPPPAADLVLCCLPAGAVDERADGLAGSAPLLLDVLYNPWPTALARAAGRTGARIVDGLDLLVGQAVEQVDLMTGRRPSPATLRSAGEAALHA